MNFTYGNSQNIAEIAREIIDLANEYNIEINNLFKKIINIPTETKEWIGNKANEYSNKVSLDKQQYVDFYELIKNFANMLIKASESIDNCIKATESESDYKDI